MMPSRLHYSLARGGQMYAADAELQTDVMRFMAILSLCLVAIFALVQSIPVAPRAPEQPRATERPPAAVPEPSIEKIVPVTKTIVPVTIESIVPVTIPAPREEPAEPERIDAAPAEPQETTAATPQQKGFTLQFEDDAALTRLISRDEVGFFAISPEKSLRLKVEGGRMDFWPSSTPGQYHEMDGVTVPAEVKTALRRSGAEFEGQQLWGVTLPPGTTAQLKQYLAGSDGGRLVIGRNGDLRLEQ